MGYRVRTRRLDPLRELQRAVETALAMGLAGAIAARAGWALWAVAAILLLWPLRVLREIRTAVAVSRNPQDTLALHERGFLADAVGPLPTRVAVVVGVAAMYVLIWPVRSGLNGVAGLAVRAAWWLLGG